MDKIKRHWEGSDDFTTFHTIALASLEKRMLKHFNTPIFILTKALDPSVSLTTWSDNDRTKPVFKLGPMEMGQGGGGAERIGGCPATPDLYQQAWTGQSCQMPCFHMPFPC